MRASNTSAFLARIVVVGLLSGACSSNHENARPGGAALPDADVGVVDASAMTSNDGRSSGGGGDSPTTSTDARVMPSRDASAMMSSDARASSDANAMTAADGRSMTPSDAACVVPNRFRWTSTAALLAPVSDATHNFASVKDPSVVFYNDRWHIFVSTVSATGGYNLAYISFADWAHVDTATFYALDQNPTLVGYHAAPQVFFFAPQNKWYMVFQSGPPQYSTNTDIANPAGWTQPANFFSAEPAVVTANKGTGGWLDFWTICDTANCYLFFSDDSGTFYRSQTAIGDFPSGFTNTVVVMKDTNAGRLFEGSNVYALKGTGKYLALVEAFDADSNYHRYFRSWTADRLDGTWTPLQDTFAAPFAGTSNVTFTGTRWTSDISHGEMVRAGFDQTLTVDPCHLQYVYQGFATGSPTTDYNSIPWRIALLTQGN